MQNETTNTNAVRELWSSTIGIDATDPNDPALVALGSLETTAKNALISAAMWAKARGHACKAEDKDEALLFAVHPFREAGERIYKTRAVLAAVSRDGTLAYLQREIGGTVDCRSTDTGNGPADIWVADDYGDVSGVNPLLSMASGFTGWQPGAGVFAGADRQGRTVSIPSLMLAANLAGTWRLSAELVYRGLCACKAPAETLDAAGLALVDFLVDSDPDSAGITIDSVTPEGAPAELLSACRKAYKESKGKNLC